VSETHVELLCGPTVQCLTHRFSFSPLHRYTSTDFPGLTALLSSGVYNDLGATGAAAIADLRLALASTNDIVEAYNSAIRRAQTVDGQRRSMLNFAYVCFFLASVLRKFGARARAREAEARARNARLAHHRAAAAAPRAQPAASAITAIARAALARVAREQAGVPSPSRTGALEVTGSLGTGFLRSVPFAAPPSSLAAAAEVALAPAPERVSARVAHVLDRALLGNAGVVGGAHERVLARLSDLAEAAREGGREFEGTFTYANLVVIFGSIGSVFRVGTDVVQGAEPAGWSCFPSGAGAVADAAFAAAAAAACARPSNASAAVSAAWSASAPTSPDLVALPTRVSCAGWTYARSV
jgi:hypothetical protein